MTVSPLVTKILLTALGLGVVSAGVSIPLSHRQSANQTLPDSSYASPSLPESDQSSLKTLDRETFETLTNKQEQDGKTCYTFFSTVEEKDEESLTSLLLFCSKADSLDGGEEAYYFWDGKDLKKALNLKSQRNSGDILITLEEYDAQKEIFVEDDDQIKNDWNTITLSECSIKSQTRILSDSERVLSCTYEKIGQGDSTSQENVFRLNRWDFSSKDK